MIGTDNTRLLRSQRGLLRQVQLQKSGSRNGEVLRHVRQDQEQCMRWTSTRKHSRHCRRMIHDTHTEHLQYTTLDCSNTDMVHSSHAMGKAA